MFDYCSQDAIIVIIKVVKIVLNLIQIGIPIILIILGVIDLGKAVIASKDEEIKKAQSMLIKRIIYAVCVFFVVLLLKFVFKFVGTLSDDTAGATSWIDCWDKIEN